MSVNPYRPHVFVLPEDYANSQLANGFHLELDPTRYRQMQVLAEAGGWMEVLKHFGKGEVQGMYEWPERLMVLLIDFDDSEDRLNIAKAAIPEDLADRVFVLGARKEPEDLKKAKLGHYETIGSVLAKECREETYTTSGWEHDLLRHNDSELDRLRERIRPILF